MGRRVGGASDPARPSPCVERGCQEFARFDGLEFCFFRVPREEPEVRKSRFTEEQIAYALSQAKQGRPVAQLCRKVGVSEQSFYILKRRDAGNGSHPLL